MVISCSYQKRQLKNLTLREVKEVILLAKNSFERKVFFNSLISYTENLYCKKVTFVFSGNNNFKEAITIAKLHVKQLILKYIFFAGTTNWIHFKIVLAIDKL